MPQGVAFVSFRQRLTCRSAGQREGVQRFIAQNPASVGDSIKQLPVVGNQHEATGPVLQKLLQPQHGGEIKVVARFVQQQQIGIAN
ncbi:hypothetical protein D3C80_929160 [compost metagenome]